MRTTQQLSVTLPREMAKMVKDKVSSGEYASESEVIRDGLRALQARERMYEAWLSREVTAAYDEAVGEPDSVLEGSDVDARLAALHEATLRNRT